MTLIRKKLSKSAILLLALLAIGTIIAVVLHFVNIIDLSFVGDWAVGAAMYASTSALTAGIIGGAIFFAGLATCYLLKDYIVGMEVNGPVPGTNNFVAPGQTLSQNSDTVIS